jgi:conjugal transfer pilus assembly protein TrbC
MAKQFNRTAASVVAMFCIAATLSANAGNEADAKKRAFVDAAIDEIEASDAKLPDLDVRTNFTEEELKQVLDNNGISLDSMLKSVSKAKEQMAPMLGIENILKQQQNRSPTEKDSQLMVFVSLDMPRPSLERIVRDARQAQAVLVLRGMKNNKMGDTIGAATALKDGLEAGWQISSLEFRDIEVTVVPTTVLRMGAKRITACEADSKTSCVSQPWYGVEGDVSIEYALEQIIKHAPESTQEAGKYLATLRKGGVENGLSGRNN